MARMGRVGLFLIEGLQGENQANALFWVEEDLEQLYERHLQKLYSHQKHKVNVQYLFEPDW